MLKQKITMKIKLQMLRMLIIKLLKQKLKNWYKFMNNK